MKSEKAKYVVKRMYRRRLLNIGSRKKKQWNSYLNKTISTKELEDIRLSTSKHNNTWNLYFQVNGMELNAFKLSRS